MEDVLLFLQIQDIKIITNTVLFGKEQTVDNVLEMHILMPIEFAFQTILIVLVLETQVNVLVVTVDTFYRIIIALWTILQLMLVMLFVQDGMDQIVYNVLLDLLIIMEFAQL